MAEVNISSQNMRVIAKTGSKTPPSGELLKLKQFDAAVIGASSLEKASTNKTLSVEATQNYSDFSQLSYLVVYRFVKMTRDRRSVQYGSASTIYQFAITTCLLRRDTV